MIDLKKGLGVIVILLVCICCTFCLFNADNVYAAKYGSVITDSLNVRTGAGTEYEILNIKGNDIRLQRGTKVTILEENAGWYKVKFKYNKKKYQGYVAAMYIGKYVDKSILAGNLSIGATMRTTQKINNKKIKKGQKVVITAVKKKSKKLWYAISFEYKGKTLSGYVKTTAVKIKKGIYKAKTVERTPVYKKASLKYPFKYKKKALSIKKGKSIKILKEKTVKNKKWYYIRFAYGGKLLKAWTLADNTMYISGKEPAKPVNTKEPPKATANPAVPLSDAEFEAAMNEAGFPESYKSALRLLHAQYPLWQFKSFNTGLEWEKAVNEESEPGVSVIPNSKVAAWKMASDKTYDYVNDKYIVYDGKNWVCASKDAVAYYMDPRNFLNEKNIFMFEALAYEPQYQTRENVELILKGTLYEGASYSYINDAGETVTKTYADTFTEAAKLFNISPIHLVSRMKQEVVTGANSVSNSVTGKVPGYEGIYNFYNIGASDSSTGQAVTNGLKFASSGTTYMRPWNNQYRAILGGAQYIAGNYVAKGQNTLYLERFNVTANNTYNHQYMTNVEAAYSESLKIYLAYSEWLAKTPYIFYIPVYRNMPEKAAPAPTANLNPNNYLKSLVVTGAVTGTVYEAVNPFTVSDGGKTEYVYNIPSAEEKVMITATPVNANARVEGTGQTSIVIAPVKINIVVTAQDGTKRNYLVTINKN